MAYELKLSGGATVQLRKLSLTEAMAQTAALQQLVADLGATVRDGEFTPAQAGAMIRARDLVQQSLLRPEEAEDLELADLPELLLGIAHVNRLTDLIKGVVKLRIEWDEAINGQS